MNESASPQTVGTEGQYSLVKILGIWAAAAVPMGILGWVVAPALAPDSTEDPILPSSLLSKMCARRIMEALLRPLLTIARQRRRSFGVRLITCFFSMPAIILSPHIFIVCWCNHLTWQAQ